MTTRRLRPRRYPVAVTGTDATLVLHVLPLAAGAAVSPALLGASVEILAGFAGRGIRTLASYLAGAALVVGAALLLATALPQRGQSADSSVVTDVIDLVLAGLLVIVAIVLVFRRAGSGDNETLARLRSSRWLALGAALLGVLMMATNISTLVLVLAGAHETASAGAGVLAAGIAYALLAVGALLPVLLPLGWAILSPTSATRQLGRLQDLLSRHGRVIGIVVCLLTAAYLIIRGLGVL